MNNPALPGSVDVSVSDRTWPNEIQVIVSTLRALLRAGSRAEAAELLQGAVRQLGGDLIPAGESDHGDLPVDVSLGVGDPLVVRLPNDDSEAQFLTAHLPSIIEDALCAARRSDLSRRETLRAPTDALRQVASRAEISSRIAVAAPGDALCLLDLDNYQQLNVTEGDFAGDNALREFGVLLLGSVRRDDFVGRTGGGEFVVLLRDSTTEGACRRMRFLANKWLISGHRGTSVSIGIAAVDHRGGPVASAAADRTKGRAKGSGRGLVELAGPDDYIDVRP